MNRGDLMRWNAICVVLALWGLLGCNACDTKQERGAVKSNAIDLATEEDKFYVNVNFKVYSEQIEHYPATWEKVQAALEEWSNMTPMRYIVFEDIDYIPQSITIHLDDLSSPRWGFPDQYLGMWRPDESTILLDADFLETDPTKAYSVALHEIGHMLGVPHVIGFYEVGPTGFVILPEGEDAFGYVMYPRGVDGYNQAILSDLEIMFARHHLMHYITRPDVNFGIVDGCELEVDSR